MPPSCPVADRPWGAFGSRRRRPASGRGSVAARGVVGTGTAAGHGPGRPNPFTTANEVARHSPSNFGLGVGWSA